MKTIAIRESFLSDLEERLNTELDALAREDCNVIDIKFVVHTDKTLIMKESNTYYFALILYNDL